MVEVQFKERFYQKSEPAKAELIRNWLNTGEIRCQHCGKLILKGSLSIGTDIEIVCPRSRCKGVSTIKVI